MKKLLNATIIVLAILNLIDMGITAYLLAQSRLITESNLLMAALWGVSPILFILYKTAVSACFFILAKHLTKIRKWMYIAIMPTTAIYCGVVGWGVYVLISAV